MDGTLSNIFHPSNFFLMMAWTYFLIVAYVTVWWERMHLRKDPSRAAIHDSGECSCSGTKGLHFSESEGNGGVSTAKSKGEHEDVHPCNSCRDKRSGKDWPDEAVRDGCMGTAIVTGASSGLGLATAMGLAKCNFHVIIACRSMEKGQEAALRILQRCDKASVDVLELNLCSLASIRSFSAKVRELIQSCRPPRSLRLLVNNAGILAASRRWTKDALERMIATNYLGAFALTAELLPLLQESPQARVVNISSFTHRAVRSVDFNPASLASGGLGGCGLTGAGRYRMAEIYQISKLFMLLFTYELHGRALRLSSNSSHVSSIAVDPGMFDSSILRELPPCLSWALSLFFSLFGLMQSSEEAAESVVSAATAPPDVSGVYVGGSDGISISSSPLSYDASLASQLWKSSSYLTSSLDKCTS